MALRGWTPEQDAVIRRMRTRDRATWHQIATVLDVPLSSLRKHAQRLDIPMEQIARRGGRGKLEWPAERIAALREMIAQRKPWDAIGPALGVCRNSAISAAKRLNLWVPRVRPRGAAEVAAIPEYRPPVATRDRRFIEALPPGAYWDMICAGTSLAGTAYPAPEPIR